MIRMSDVSMEYDNGVRAVKKATLRIDEGEFVFLVGPSGSGKSTLIKLLTGEVKPTSGRIVVNNYNIGAIKKREIPYLRRTLGVVFQDFRLIEKKTVYENVAFAMRAVGAKNRAIRKRVPYVLDLVGLSEKADTRPLELSGGEQQRVAIARALVNNPRLIIADEPTGNLDPVRSYELMTLFEKINELGTTILIVTHEKELVDEFEKRVIMIDNGEIVSDATGRYYADDEYYDDDYIEEQVQENIDEQPKVLQPEDAANATLTMLFERLNAKKTEEPTKEEMTQDTKPISNDIEITSQTAVLSSDDDTVNDIQKQAAQDIVLHMESKAEKEANDEIETEQPDITEIVNNSGTEQQEVSQPEVSNPETEQQEVSQPEVSKSEAEQPEVSKPEVSNPEVEQPEVSQHEVDNSKAEQQETNQPEVNDSDKPENKSQQAENPTKEQMPNLSQFSNRVGMNTAMMSRKQPQRVKTSVGSVDASLEELIQRFEQRVGIKDNNKEQAGGETENEQKNAETEASQQ